MKNSCFRFIIINCILEKLIIYHLLFLVSQHLIHIILDIWELINDQKECVTIVFEHGHFCLCSEIVYCLGSLKYTVVINHLALLEVPLGPLIFYNTVHDKVNKFWRATLFAN